MTLSRPFTRATALPWTAPAPQCLSSSNGPRNGQSTQDAAPPLPSTEKNICLILLATLLLIHFPTCPQPASMTAQSWILLQLYSLWQSYQHSQDDLCPLQITNNRKEQDHQHNSPYAQRDSKFENHHRIGISTRSEVSVRGCYEVNPFTLNLQWIIQNLHI